MVGAGGRVPKLLLTLLSYTIYQYFFWSVFVAWAGQIHVHTTSVSLSRLTFTMNMACPHVKDSSLICPHRAFFRPCKPFLDARSLPTEHVPHACFFWIAVWKHVPAVPCAVVMGSRRRRVTCRYITNTLIAPPFANNHTIIISLWCHHMGPVWIHGLELVWASWSSTSPKVAKQKG